MIVSTDRKHAFFGIPKAGSTTMHDILKPIGQDLTSAWGPHATRCELHQQMEELYGMSYEESGSIVGYAFYREPIDRFLSGCNYVRGFPAFLISEFRELFGVGAPYDLSKKGLGNLRYRLTPEKFQALDLATRGAMSSVPVERIMEYGLRVSRRNLIFSRQNDWFKHPNMYVLDFTNFESEARKLIDLFGGNSANTQVPILNASGDIMEPIARNKIPPSLMHHIEYGYVDDADFKPGLIVNELIVD